MVTSNKLTQAFFNGDLCSTIIAPFHSPGTTWKEKGGGSQTHSNKLTTRLILYFSGQAGGKVQLAKEHSQCIIMIVLALSTLLVLWCYVSTEARVVSISNAIDNAF